jgi:hypothetical protein
MSSKAKESLNPDIPVKAGALKGINYLTVGKA